MDVDESESDVDVVSDDMSVVDSEDISDDADDDDDSEDGAVAATLAEADAPVD